VPAPASHGYAVAAVRTRAFAALRAGRDDEAVEWTAPVVVRADRLFVAGERDMLQGFLDFGRRTLLVKCAGLTGEQLTERAVPPSALSLLGLVRHVADMERTWFRRRFAGEDVGVRYAAPARPDAAFEDARAEDAERDLVALREEWAAVDRAVAGLSLEHVYVTERWGPMQLRWGYSHLISEYNRHNGHADLLRERIDGTTGT
jgi:uncharacterized damage-inducible protein DinB